MYKIKVKDSEYTIPKENLIPFALYEMHQRGLIFSGIDSDEVAITFLKGIGIEVSDVEK